MLGKDELERKWNAAESMLTPDDEQDFAADNRAILAETRLIGAAMIMILVIALVLTEVFGAIDISSGPFADVATSLETTGSAALTLLVVGLLVVAATSIMDTFGGGGR